MPPKLKNEELDALDRRRCILFNGNRVSLGGVQVHQMNQTDALLYEHEGFSRTGGWFVSFWFKSYDLAQAGQVFCNVWERGTADARWCLRQEAPQPRLLARFSDVNGTDALQGTVTFNKDVLVQDVWQHLVFGFDPAGGSSAGRAKAWVDKVEITDKTATSGGCPSAFKSPVASRLAWAKWPGASSSDGIPWRGCMRDLRYHATTPTQAIVDALYDGKVIETAPVLRAPCEEDAGDCLGGVKLTQFAPYPFGPAFIPMNFPVGITPKGYKIHLMGDSNIAGSAESEWFKVALRAELLMTFGIHVNFVGALDGSGDLPAWMNDPEHQGTSGQRIDEAAALVRGWMDATEAHAILLMYATNDISQGASAATCITRYRQLLNLIVSHPRWTRSNPVFAMPVYPKADMDTAEWRTTVEFWGLLEALGAEYRAAGYSVYVPRCGQRIWSPAEMSADKGHSNRVGSEKAANAAAPMIAEVLQAIR